MKNDAIHRPLEEVESQVVELVVAVPFVGVVALSRTDGMGAVRSADCIDASRGIVYDSWASTIPSRGC